MLVKIFRLAIALWLFAIPAIQAQVVSSSPYTIRGIGEVRGTGIAHNLALGGIGTGYGVPWHLNTANPAMLTQNILTTFEMGAQGQYRNVSTTLLGSENGSGSLSYVGLGLPVIPGKWTASFGMQPFSAINYSISVMEEEPLGPDTLDVFYNYRGSGGINKAYFSTGVEVFKNFSLGIEARYLFGAMFEESVASINDEADTLRANYLTAYQERTRVGDFAFMAAAAYRHSIHLGKSKKDSVIHLNLGLAYDLSTDVKADQFASLERRSLTDLPLLIDTLSFDEPGSFTLPATYKGGISLASYYRWAVGVDFEYTDWSAYRHFSGGNEGLGTSYRLSLGGELTPDYLSIDNYFSRITYQLGGFYEQTALTVNDNPVQHIGVSAGLSLPVPNSRGSSVNLLAQYGRKGSRVANLVQEDYIKVYLGVTINDKWFNRRKFD